MENTIKVRKIERKKTKSDCLSFLKEARVNDAYLFEGIAQGHARFHNYCFIQDGRIVGIVHSKSGSSVHLFFSGSMAVSSREKAVKFIEDRFPGLKMLFGDALSVRTFEKFSGEKSVSVKNFITMEICRPWLCPRQLYRGMTPPPDMASQLLPLQIQYEIEEVGACASDINRGRVLTVLKKKMMRKEVSAVLEGPVPVAMAGVNARYENICQIGSVYVVPSRRGRGYGSSVVSYHLVQLFKRYERVLLFVNTANKSAYSLYRRLGFRDTGMLMQAYF